MMHSDAEKKLARLVDLVDERKLPKSAIPRLFYQGHTLLHGFSASERRYKCVNCGKEGSMPECSCGSDDIFDISNDREAKWECVECKHQWIAEDGTKCPACGVVREGKGAE